MTQPEELEYEAKLFAITDNQTILLLHLDAALRCLEKQDTSDAHVKTENTSAIVKLRNLQVLVGRLYERRLALHVASKQTRT